MTQENTAPDGLDEDAMADAYNEKIAGLTTDCWRAFKEGAHWAASARPSVPQEPVAWEWRLKNSGEEWLPASREWHDQILSKRNGWPECNLEARALYAAPVVAVDPSVEPASLTDDEIDRLQEEYDCFGECDAPRIHDLARAIERLVLSRATPAATTPEPATPAGSREPAGWKLVPIEPTSEMLGAAYDLQGSMRFNPIGIDYWHSMLNAAPVLAGSRAAETASPNSVHQAEASEKAPGAANNELRGLDTAERVRFYEHEFYPLSNFSAFTLMWRGVRFDTSEAAYHCEKFMGTTDGIGVRVQIRKAPSAHEAFKIAERNKALRRADWDSVKVDIMRNILRAKVDQHEYVRRKLLATGDRELVEDSWRDDFWGWGPNRDGKNMLGRLWMEVRAELTATASGTDSTRSASCPKASGAATDSHQTEKP